MRAVIARETGMIPRNTEGATNSFVKPEGWTEVEDGRCGVLSVRVDQHGRRKYHVSTWEPTKEELDALNRGACVELTCVGLQPPVALAVGKVPDSSTTVRKAVEPPPPVEPKREYTCPVCGSHDPQAYARCYHPGCTDGRDPR